MASEPGPGTTIEDWTLEELLGEGGMARVFLARDETSGRRAALKLLTLDDEGVVKRFAQEAALLGRVRHPHLVKVFASGVSGRLPWMAMELLTGRSLSDVMREKKIFTLDEALALFGQLADALQALHAAGVVHRDLKPANVMVDDAGWVTLLDLGIAREGEGGLTQTGMVIGTPGYMAPEQILAEKNITPAADVYAFAVMLWRALVGTRPFQGKGDDLLKQHLFATRPLLRDVRPDLPGGLTALFVSALAAEPQARPPTASALWADLERALDGTTRVPTSHKPLEWLAGAPEATRNDRPMAMDDVTSPASLALPTIPAGDLPVMAASHTLPHLAPVPETGATVQGLVPVPERPPVEVAGETVQRLAPVTAGETVLKLPQVPDRLPPAVAPSLASEDARLLKVLAGIAVVALLAVGLASISSPPPPPEPEPVKFAGPVPGRTPPPKEEAPEATPDLLARREEARAHVVPPSPVGPDGFSINKVREVKPHRISQRRGGGTKGGVEIIVTRDGAPVKADVTVDGRYVGQAPVALSATAGKHSGRVDEDRTFPTRFEFYVNTAKEPVRLEIELTPHR